MTPVVLLSCGATAICVAFLTFFVARKFSYAKMLLCIEQNNAKIKALETEIEQLLHNKHVKMQEEETKFNQRLSMRQNELEKTIQEHEENKRIINLTKQEVLRQKEEQAKILERCQEEKLKLSSLLQDYTALTKEEGKKILLKNLEDELIQERSSLIRRYETEAKAEAKRKANYIIAQATTRFAGEFVSDRLVNNVRLVNDEMKGKIIGKEGRNIKAFEMVCGVNLIIDDTPNEISLSSFSLYRRALATRTLEILMQDGRIHPSRIEEVYEKVKAQAEEQLYQEGDEILLELGIGS